MVDYATRYTDAVPLKDIQTETVAEAMVVNMFTRIGVQRKFSVIKFLSAVMKEVCRLLSVKQLATTP